MMESGNKEEGRKKVNEVEIFSVPSALRAIKKNITINTKQPSKERIINLALGFHSQGKISEAAKYYEYCINQNFNEPTIFSNYGLILKDFGKLEEAELSIRKAIEIKPDFSDAHSNLGIILRALGKLKEAELSTRKAIKIKPDYAEAHYNLGNILKDLGKLNEAELSTRKAIKIKPDFAMAHNNLGNTFKDLGKLKEAELSTRKAIKIKPKYAEAYYNLGNILRDLGKLKEAELSILRAIQINPNLSKAYFSLSTLQYTNENAIWKDQIFSESILQNKSQIDKVDIYFARANILHKEKNYQDSARNLILANKLKLELYPSKPDIIIKKSQALLIESNKKGINQKEQAKSPESIFIVGMFRSGSTLLESILNINNNVSDLGEINILEESFIDWKKSNQSLTLAEIYWKKTNHQNGQLKITTNKWLFNYQYTGIIAKWIPNAKIIHCYRNPLDNILSIYRVHFNKVNSFTSSLVDSAKIFLDQEEIMTAYKNRFRSKIYDLNYDSLVKKPKEEIKSLINWLGWEWDNAYLSPHLNRRSVSTASSIQVRSPINSKSIGGWKNYKDMLKPAIKILIKTNQWKNITT